MFKIREEHTLYRETVNISTGIVNFNWKSDRRFVFRWGQFENTFKVEKDRGLTDKTKYNQEIKCLALYNTTSFQPWRGKLFNKCSQLKIHQPHHSWNWMSFVNSVNGNETAEREKQWRFICRFFPTKTLKINLKKFNNDTTLMWSLFNSPKRHVFTVNLFSRAVFCERVDFSTEIDGDDSYQFV